MAVHVAAAVSFNLGSVTRRDFIMPPGGAAEFVRANEGCK